MIKSKNKVYIYYYQLWQRNGLETSHKDRNMNFSSILYPLGRACHHGHGSWHGKKSMITMSRQVSKYLI